MRLKASELSFLPTVGEIVRKHSVKAFDPAKCCALLAVFGVGVIEQVIAVAATSELGHSRH